MQFHRSNRSREYQSMYHCEKTVCDPVLWLGTGSIAHRTWGKAVKISVHWDFFFQKEDGGVLLFQAADTETKLLQYWRKSPLPGFMYLAKNPPHTHFAILLIILLQNSRVIPLLSEDNSNFNTPNNNVFTLSIPFCVVNANRREQFYSSQMRQALQRHKLSSGKLLKQQASPRRQTTTAQPDTQGDEWYHNLPVPESAVLISQAAWILSHHLPVNLPGAGAHLHQLL